jgi:uncharacterized protein
LAPKVMLALLAAVSLGCGRETSVPAPEPSSAAGPLAPAPLSAVPGPTAPEKIVLSARREVEKKTPYQPGYHRITYPGGDVPTGGVCTDLVARAFRGAGVDLQQLVHEDMTASFASYPRLWGASRPDPNIDHRRVPNLMVLFQRRGHWLPTGTAGTDAASWQLGDVVFWDLPGGLKHCGIVSDRRGTSGRPLVIHNIGTAAEEDCLTRWTVIGHGRLREPR